MEETVQNQKVITLDALKTAINKIREDYPTRAEVTEQIANAGTGSIDYATDEDILALFTQTNE